MSSGFRCYPCVDRPGKPDGSLITTTALLPGTVGQPLDQSLEATGGTGPYTWTVSPTLPAGLTLDSSRGKLCGTASVALPATNFLFTATDSGTPARTATATLSLIIT